ncbi:MAG: hypothetical protein WCD79_11285 [Chthoniobacteraceae bacterium]
MKTKSSLFLLIPLISLTLLSRTAYPQDDTAPPIRVTETLHPDGTKTVMRSDPENHTSTAEIYNKADKLLSKLVYTLDDQGQATGATAYSAAGKELYKLGYKRDAAGNVSEVATYSVAGILVSRTVYQYASGGKVISINTYDANGNQISASTAPPNGGATPAQKRGSYNPNR